MTRYLFGFALGFAILALAIPEEWLDQVAAQPGEDLTTKAKSVVSPEFLKTPAGIDASQFAVAKTAPTIEVAFFAGLHDRGKGTLWSSWGDGCLHSNGNYYTSVGDHLGVDGSCHVYEYNPATKVLRRVVDVLRAIRHALGLYGHGKIHSGIHEAADGSLYFSTYWGKHREIDAAFEKGYDGSIVLRFDPKTGTTENLGAIVPRQGLPASHFDRSRGLLYFHAVYKGDITVFNTATRKVDFRGGGDTSAASRTFLADAKGNVYFSGTGGTLHYYDPVAKSLVESKAKLPASAGSKKGDSLRAAAQRPAKDGSLFGMTASGRIFRMDPAKHDVKDLGANFAEGHYTAVMAISPDDKYLYYVPGAHGGNVKIGVPVVQFEIATRKQKVLAFLGEAFRKELKIQAGGTYNLQLDPRGERLFITLNAAPVDTRGAAFGLPCVVTLAIPPGER